MIFDAVLGAMKLVWVTFHAIDSMVRAVLGVLGVMEDILVLGRSCVVLGAMELS